MVSWDSWSSSPVSHGLSSSDSSKKPGAGAGWGDLGELVESEALSTGLLDSGSGGVGELEGANSQLRDLNDSLVVQHWADDTEDLGLFLLGVSELDQLGEGDWVPGNSGLVQSLVHDLVESGVSSSGQEGVQLVKVRFLVIEMIWEVYKVLR